MDGVKSVGRPSPYDPEIHPELARKLCLLGTTNQQLADILDVGISTIDLWIRTHAEFSCALKKGRALADIEVAATLYQRALAGDVTACIFWLKNRKADRWREKHEYVVESEAPQGPLDSELLKSATEEELKTMLQFMKKYSVQ
jgi:hypothetical protein